MHYRAFKFVDPVPFRIKISTRKLYFKPKPQKMYLQVIVTQTIQHYQEVPAIFLSHPCIYYTVFKQLTDILL